MPPWAWYTLFGLAVGLVTSFLVDHALAAWRRRNLAPPSGVVFFAGDRQGERTLLSAIEATRREVVLLLHNPPSGGLLQSLNHLSDMGIKVRAIVGNATTGADCRFAVVITPQDVSVEWIVIDQQSLIRGTITQETEGLQDRLFLHGQPDLALAYVTQFEVWQAECERLQPVLPAAAAA